MPWQKGAFAEQAAKWKVYDRMRTRWRNGSRSANGMWHEWKAHTHTTQIVVCASECRRKMTVLCVFFGGGCEPDCSIYLYAPIVFMHNRKFHYATTTFSFIAWVFFFFFIRALCAETFLWCYSDMSSTQKMHVPYMWRMRRTWRTNEDRKWKRKSWVKTCPASTFVVHVTVSYSFISTHLVLHIYFYDQHISLFVTLLCVSFALSCCVLCRNWHALPNKQITYFSGYCC